MIQYFRASTTSVQKVLNDVLEQV